MLFRPPRRAPRRGGRFGPLALALVGALGLSAGVATGSVISDRPVTAVGSPRLDEITAVAREPAAPPVAEVPDPRTLPAAPPAASQVLDDTWVDPDGLTLADRRAGLLSVAVPTEATGTLVVVPGNEPAPHPDRTVRTVRVEFEEGLDIEGEVLAQFVMSALNDPRGWGGDGSLSFARTDGTAQIRVVVASPSKVDAMCAPLFAHGEYSCGRNGHAALNHTRWVQATDEFPDRTLYRQYLVNHEIGRAHV